MSEERPETADAQEALARLEFATSGNRGLDAQNVRHTLHRLVAERDTLKARVAELEAEIKLLSAVPVEIVLTAKAMAGAFYDAVSKKPRPQSETREQAIESSWQCWIEDAALSRAKAVGVET